MMRLSGWLLDASIDCNNDGFTLWIKEKGKTRGLVYMSFNPSLYMSVNDQVGRTLEDIAQSIEEIADLSTNIVESTIYIVKSQAYKCLRDEMKPFKGTGGVLFEDSD